MKRLRTLVYAVLLSFAAAGCRARQAEIFRQTPIKADAPALYKEYRNEADSNKKYQGKYMELTGTVAEVGENSVGQFYAILQGGDNLGDVRCLFSKQAPDEDRRIKPGQAITVRGVCLGKVMNVMLDECRL